MASDRKKAIMKNCFMGLVLIIYSKVRKTGIVSFRSYSLLPGNATRIIRDTKMNLFVLMLFFKGICKQRCCVKNSGETTKIGIEPDLFGSESDFRLPSNPARIQITFL
jgi:hypothetical protein